MKKAVVTITVGATYQEIANLTHPTLKAYADKIGADFIVIDDAKIKYPHWQKFEISKLLIKYKRIIFLDTDLIIRDDCPNLFDIVPEEKLGLFEEGRFSPRGGYLQQAMVAYNMNDHNYKDVYYNTGVMVISRVHTQLFNYVPTEDIMTAGNFLGEQTFLNLRIQKEGIDVFMLPYKYNRMTLMDEITGEPRFASYIIHYAGCPSHEQMLHHIKTDLKKWEKDAPDYKYKRNIVISIGGGLGDQVCGEPVARYIIEKLYPGENICILANWPRLFEHLDVPVYPHNHTFIYDDDNGPYHVRETLPSVEKPLWRHLTNPLSHTVEFGSISACGRMIPDVDKKIKLNTTLKGFDEVINITGMVNIENLVLVHPGKGWPSKTFPIKWWQDIIDGLVNVGHQVGIIGKRVNEDQGHVSVECPEGVVDFRDLLSLDGLISLISGAKVLISNDSAPIHIAGAFDNWIVLIPSCKHPDHVLPYRNGYKHYKSVALYKMLTLDKINSAPTMFAEGGQTLDYVVGDILDYLPEVGQVIKEVDKIIVKEKTL